MKISALLERNTKLHICFLFCFVPEKVGINQEVINGSDIPIRNTAVGRS